MKTKDPKNSVHKENEQFSTRPENDNQKPKDSVPDPDREDQEVKETERPANSGNQTEKEQEKQEEMHRGTGEKINQDDTREENNDKESRNPGNTREEKMNVSSSSTDEAKISEESEKDSPANERVEEQINYALLSKHDLLEIFKELLDRGKVNEIGKEVAAIKASFYKQHRAEIAEKKAKFLNEGGNEKDFSPGISEEEESLKSLLKKYSDLRAEYNKLRESEKNENLKKKHQIIEEIKELANRDEAINITFQEFRDLQKRWHEVGPVPPGELKNLWETYHYYVEKFYDYIKINKELRDLDLKKNLEAKIKLCEKAEELILEPNIVNAFKILQKYHDQWREIGPVPREKRTEIWERFKEATSKINKNHQQYYQELKENQKKNLESKKVLCEKAELVADMEINDHQTYVQKTKEILDIQKVWKTIGFAPKKDNNKIYARFRAACDKFFNKKREYYARGLEEQQENLQKKLDLCIQAEALQDSTDWKNTTDELITLQKKWKKIGPVPRKKSDQVWKRFRSACDQFFNRKSEFYSNIEQTYTQNLRKKEELIQEIREFKPEDSQKKNLSRLNDLQKKWTEIGFVPYEKKDQIMQEYRDAVNQQYDKLEMDDHRKNVLKFKTKLESIKKKPHPENKLRFEREKLMNKLHQLKNDIVLWENNIGFFAESKNADSMIRDFQQKIENAREKIKLLEDKIIMIDESEE